MRQCRLEELHQREVQRFTATDHHPHRCALPELRLLQNVGSQAQHMRRCCHAQRGAAGQGHGGRTRSRASSRDGTRTQAATSCFLHVRAMCCVSFSLPGGTMTSRPPPKKMLNISCAQRTSGCRHCLWLRRSHTRVLVADAQQAACGRANAAHRDGLVEAGRGLLQHGALPQAHAPGAQTPLPHAQAHGRGSGNASTYIRKLKKAR